jgi:putative acetyltransferase
MTLPVGGVSIVRPESPKDVGSVRVLLEKVFEDSAEADLVERLRLDGDLVLAMIATDASNKIFGCAAFPRLHVEHAGQEFPAVGLAPLAVAEPYRRQGIGTDLVCGGLDCLALRGETLVFVLGDPAYYTRFGFALDLAQPFICVYAGPYFMALRLADTAPRAGIVRYPAVFEGLS